MSRSLHEIGVAQLEADMKLALNLAGRLEARCQALASTIGVFLVAISLAVSANNKLAASVDERGFTWVGVVVVSCWSVSLISAGISTVPGWMKFSHPDALLDLATEDDSHIPFSAEELESEDYRTLVKGALRLQVEQYRSTLNALRWRSRALIVGQSGAVAGLFHALYLAVSLSLD